MTNYEVYSLLIAGFTALATLGGFVYASFQLKKTKEQVQAAYKINEADHEWNRRKASQDALKEYNQSILFSELQPKFNYLNCTESIPLANIKEEFETHPNLQAELHQLLNFYESLARGIFHKLYDEEIIKAARSLSELTRQKGQWVSCRRQSNRFFD